MENISKVFKGLSSPQAKLQVAVARGTSVAKSIISKLYTVIKRMENIEIIFDSSNDPTLAAKLSFQTLAIDTEGNISTDSRGIGFHNKRLNDEKLFRFYFTDLKCLGDYSIFETHESDLS